MDYKVELQDKTISITLFGLKWYFISNLLSWLYIVEVEEYDDPVVNFHISEYLCEFEIWYIFMAFCFFVKNVSNGSWVHWNQKHQCYYAALDLELSLKWTNHSKESNGPP